MRQHNIAMATIKDIQRHLEDSPARESSEVSKVQALRLLAPQILLMQSKGYSAAHIAGLLSERGVVVTAATLKSHLSRFKSAEALEALRAKPPKRTGRETSLSATPSRAVAPPKCRCPQPLRQPSCRPHRRRRPRRPRSGLRAPRSRRAHLAVRGSPFDRTPKTSDANRHGSPRATRANAPTAPAAQRRQPGQDHNEHAGQQSPPFRGAFEPHP